MKIFQIFYNFKITIFSFTWHFNKQEATAMLILYKPHQLGYCLLANFWLLVAF